MPVDELTAILLAGGLGTRIRQLHPQVPKPMVPVLGKPFLEWLVRYWLSQGIQRFVIATGYRSDVIEGFLKSFTVDGACIVTISEQTPLGTGGAVLQAATSTRCSDPFLVVNADSLAIVDAAKMWPALHAPEVDGLIVGIEMDDASRYGSLEVGRNDELLGFAEKRPGSGLVNAGVYVFKNRLLALFPQTSPLSLEKEVFPALLKAGAEIRVLRADVPFLDIGTPQSLVTADEFIRRNLAVPSV